MPSEPKVIKTIHFPIDIAEAIEKRLSVYKTTAKAGSLPSFQSVAFEALRAGLELLPPATSSLKSAKRQAKY